MTETANHGWLNGRWWLGVLAIWLGITALMLFVRAPDIAALALGDTDDNLRLAQVRALIGGQAWYDLIQYRLAPPEGADIHWSRLPDLPIAGLILLLEPILGAASGERWAVALAPLIPFAIGLCAIALIVRRTASPIAWPLAMLVTFCASILMPMWLPLRIDHHGWQLALLAVGLAGLVDPRAARGGATAGIAGALSFAIGLEMLIFLALIGATLALLWGARCSAQPAHRRLWRDTWRRCGNRLWPVCIQCQPPPCLRCPVSCLAIGCRKRRRLPRPACDTASQEPDRPAWRWRSCCCNYRHRFRARLARLSFPARRRECGTSIDLARQCSGSPALLPAGLADRPVDHRAGRYPALSAICSRSRARGQTIARPNPISHWARLLWRALLCFSGRRERHPQLSCSLSREP